MISLTLIGSCILIHSRRTDTRCTCGWRPVNLRPLKTIIPAQPLEFDGKVSISYLDLIHPLTRFALAVTTFVEGSGATPVWTITFETCMRSMPLDVQTLG